MDNNIKSYPFLQRVPVFGEIVEFNNGAFPFGTCIFERAFNKHWRVRKTEVIDTNRRQVYIEDPKTRELWDGAWQPVMELDGRPSKSGIENEPMFFLVSKRCTIITPELSLKELNSQPDRTNCAECLAPLKACGLNNNIKYCPECEG